MGQACTNVLSGPSLHMLDELAWKTLGKKCHTIDVFSLALVAIPTIMVDKTSLHSADLVAQLRKAPQKGYNAWID